MAEKTLKVLIVGGYGTFGGRLVQLLKSDARLKLVVAGRSLKKASAYCEACGKTEASLVAAEFDRNGNLDTQLVASAPDIVVDASGPFQAYGEPAYTLVQACIAKRIHYLDLADGSDFVAGISAFDGAAREQGIFVLSGVSTCPVLTAAAVRELSKDMIRVDRIRAGIAPSPFAGVGENVIRAIASYAGKRVALKRNGESAVGHPFTEQMHFTIAPPGCVPLQRTLFSLADVPDLRVLPELWPEARTIWFGAGPTPEALHRILIAFAWLVWLRVVRSLSPLARVMAFATNRLRWGEHRGGMFVETSGTNAQGARIERSWHLVAEGDDGPFIPAMPAAATIKKVLDGKHPPSGARAATRELELDDYEPLFAGLKITTGIRERAEPSAPLYRRILGVAFRTLPAEIVAMHEVAGDRSAEGRAIIERGNGIVANLIASLIGFPRAGNDVPLRVRFSLDRGVETWTRDFGGASFSSCQYEGRGRSEHLLCERFGPLVFAMALVARDDRLQLVLRRWSFLGVPLPMWLCPRSEAFESVEGGRFRFYVEIRVPLIGLIVRYKGWLICDNAQAGATFFKQVSYGHS